MTDDATVVGSDRTPGPAPDRHPASESGDRSARRPRVDADRAALWTFVVFSAVAGPLVLFHYGSYHWFMRDEFVFLAERGSGFPDLLEPHGGSHWVAVPRLIYLTLWQAFGLTTYLPYQACVVALHLAVAALLRTVMRRSGVGPWLATAAAGILVLFGPGSQNIVWAFQVSFTGSVAYGLAHLVLADHDDGLGRRDVLGLALGVLGLASSGVGVTMVAVVGLAVLVRRGWRAALFHTAPLAVVYGAWMLAADPASASAFGRPSLGVLWSWVVSAQIGTFVGIGHFPVLAAGLVVVLAAGLVALALPPRRELVADLRRRLAAPVSLLLGGLLFATTTGLGRWHIGDDGARASRYVYLGAVMTLPLLAIAAQAIATRWRALTPIMVGLFLLPIPFNLAAFEPEAFGPGYMDQRERVLTTAVRMPFARSVPRDVQPIPDPFASDDLTIGFLLTALENGKLTPSTVPLGPQVVNEFRVRLGVAQREQTDAAVGCIEAREPRDIAPDRGDSISFTGALRVSTRDGDTTTSRPVAFTARRGGSQLTFELDDLELRLEPAPGAASFVYCSPG